MACVRSPDALGYAYRIADKPAWECLAEPDRRLSHRRLEVVQRTLRVRDQGHRRESLCLPKSHARLPSRA